MGPIVFPDGETLSIPFGEFIFSLLDGPIKGMNTVEETRRMQLRQLVKKHSSMADLCQQLGYARTETATLTRILNGNLRHDRGGKLYNMGSPMAREIEAKLSLPIGWMDTPPSLAEQYGQTDPRNKVWELIEAMPQSELATAYRLLNAIAQPEPKASNGK